MPNLGNAKLALLRALEVSRQFPLPNNNAQYQRLMEAGLAEVEAVNSRKAEGAPDA